MSEDRYEDERDRRSEERRIIDEMSAHLKQAHAEIDRLQTENERLNGECQAAVARVEWLRMVLSAAEDYLSAAEKKPVAEVHELAAEDETP